MAGRPKKTERKDNVLRIRLTDDERSALDDTAARRSLETSTWARSELLGLAKKAVRYETGDHRLKA
jgi:hypothetical protein